MSSCRSRPAAWSCAALLALGLAAAGPARAHPHIFIDAGVVLETDAAGRVVAVSVTWRYDELYSLILLSDYGLDPDADLVLTEAEIAATLGFDLNWGDGFTGGLRLVRGTAELDLGTPQAVSLVLRPDGRLESTHRRSVSGDPGGAVPLEARVYDPDFYVAFEAILPSRLGAAPGCTPRLERADLDAAYAALEAEIAAIGGAIAAEDNFPAVGALFADRLVFACAG